MVDSLIVSFRFQRKLWSREVLQPNRPSQLHPGIFGCVISGISPACKINFYIAGDPETDGSHRGND